ncbi:hypothetical protein [Streptomyces sp. NPDC047042]|uniref:hypothetical protein n=1 Tax=Streptomyces sp. NPDC047042 TaxID=3154807 RepID=UPI0033C6917C
MPLNEVLYIRLGLSEALRDLRHAPIRRMEQLQARHLPLLSSKTENTSEGMIVSAITFDRVKMVWVR